jgi:hypothetical protein
MNNVPEFTFEARGDGMASDRHLLETLRQKVFKVRLTDNDSYEWLQWTQHVPGRQSFSAFKTVRVKSRGNDGIVQPGPGKPTWEDNYAVTLQDLMLLFEGESIPEWIMPQLNHRDYVLLQGWQDMLHDVNVSTGLARPQ